MRPIKFRAWDKKENRYWYSDQQGSEVGEALTRWLTNPDRYIVEQFTGLLDKNGKEIYEGDIIEWRTKGNEKDRMALEFITRYGQVETQPTINITSEVIGNIYENPALLS
jgi:hypothetical protein